MTKENNNMDKVTTPTGFAGTAAAGYTESMLSGHQADCHAIASTILLNIMYDNVTLAVSLYNHVSKFRIPNHTYYENGDPQIFITFLGPLGLHFHKEIGDTH